MARPGDANISRTALTLPHSLFLEQGHIGTVCTNPKLATHTCPAASVYGHAEAVSPLLAEPLRGPVYLVPSGHELPDLVADLQGQVEIQLHGTVGSRHGGLRTVFEVGPGRAGDEVRAQHAGRSQEPAGQLDQHLQAQAARRARDQGAEREEGHQPEAAAEHRVLQAAQEGSQAPQEGSQKHHSK